MNTVASILIKGIKQRFYFNDSVFLPNDTEFEIEFFNKSQRTVCPQITINGEMLGSSPVVYNGQKFILKDYIDDNRNLLFKVYEVDSDDEDVKKAIKDNGIISFKYYYEKLITKKISKTSTAEPSRKLEDEDRNDVDLDALTDFQPIAESMAVKHETGKIMRGSPSGVTYDRIQIHLDYDYFETQVIKLLPLSKKPKYISCPNCQNSSKIDANYCEVCGHQYSPA
jgi:hypothetical protein